MGKLLTNDELKMELEADYSYRTVNKKSLEMRKKNILAFNSISRNGLKHNQKEKRVLLYETLHSEKVYIQFPGKESIEKPEMPYDFRPKLQLSTGEIVQDLSFGAIWDILDEIGKSHNAYLNYVAAIFFRLGYMYDYQVVNEKCKCYEITFLCGKENKCKEVADVQLSWYRINLSENLWYTLNDRIGWIDIGQERKISFEGFIKLVDLLFQNEDCKYYYKNTFIKEKENYKLENGRINSSAANLLILNYLEGNVQISKLLDSFQKSRGVPSFKKSDYSIVTNGIVVNVDVETRK